MSYSDDFRAGNTQYEVTSNASNILYFEILATSIWALIYFKSWYALGGVLIGLMIGVQLPIVSNVIAIAYTLCWGGAGFAIGFYQIAKGSSYEAGIVLAVIGLFFGYNAHANALVWVRDLSR